MTQSRRCSQRKGLLRRTILVRGPESSLVSESSFWFQNHPGFQNHRFWFQNHAVLGCRIILGFRIIPQPKRGLDIPKCRLFVLAAKNAHSPRKWTLPFKVPACAEKSEHRNLGGNSCARLSMEISRCFNPYKNCQTSRISAMEPLSSSFSSSPPFPRQNCWIRVLHN